MTTLNDTAPVGEAAPAAGPDYLQMAREAFSTSTTYFDASIRRDVENSMRQFQGVHPPGSKYHADSYKARSRLYRPKTRTTIRKNEATAAEAFFATNDVVSVTAQDDTDEMQQASAEFMQALLNYRLKKSIPWFLTVIGAYQDAQTIGVCISYQNWAYDPRKKIDKPVITLLPVENIRIDPGANWTDPINSSPYLIELIPMYVKDVKSRMNRADDKTGRAKWKMLPDSALLSAMNKYGDTTRQTRERGRTDSKEQSQAITDFAVVWVHKNIIEIDGVDMLWYTLGDTHLLSEPVPLEQVYFHGRRPYTMGMCILETHKTYPGGVPSLTKDLIAEINEVANQRMDNVKFAMNKRYFAKRGAQVDLRSLTRNVPGSATMMTDPEKDVIVHSTPDVTRSSYEEQDRLNGDFDDVSGAFSQSSIDSNRKLNETVGGLNILNGNANTMGSYQLRTFVETWVEPVLAQLVLLEQFYETDDVVLALAGKKADLVQKFGIDTITDELLMGELTLEVGVGLGATNPQERVNNFVKAMSNLRMILENGVLEKYGMDVREVIKELFGKLGYRDGGRFFNSKDADPRLLAAQATISELEQKLSQKTDPALVAAQIKKIDAEILHLGAKNADVDAAAIKKTLEAIFAGMQGAQMIAAVPTIAPIADKLMQSAGYKDRGGIDPNFPQPAAPDSAIGIDTVKDPRTGLSYMPGDPAAAQPAAGDTTPLTPAAMPAPASAIEGANQGIETMRSDS